MASIGKLVSTIAEVEGLEIGAVKLVSRYLREAGLISQQARGGGAARMTTLDAAHLLIGVNVPGLAKNSVAAVEAYRNLRIGIVARTNNENYFAIPFVMTSGINFADSLAKLIELSSPKEHKQSPVFLDLFGEMMREESPDAEAYDRYGLKVEFYAPWALAYIGFYRSQSEEPYREDVFVKAWFRPACDDSLRVGENRDREDRTSIGLNTIHAVAAAIND